MAEQLTPQQRQAVENRGGRLLVSAAAGSGKTKVLIDRLMGYVTDPLHHANIDDFLIITYTKAAAAELRGKIAAKLSERLAQEPENKHLQRQMQRLYLAKISTVHAYCTDLLREYAYALDMAGDFRVADENECCQLREQAMTQLLDEAYRMESADPDFRAFVDTQGLGRDDRLVPEIIQKVYDSARCHLQPEMWLEKCLENTKAEADMDAAQSVWGGYLLEQLHQTLDEQISAMEKCTASAEKDPALDKVSALLRQTVEALEALRRCQTWDQVLLHKDIRYGTLRFPKKIADPELAERIKSVRDSCKKCLAKQLKVFADPSAQVMEDLTHTAAAVRGLVKLVRGFDERYQMMKKRRRVMDFSDLEHRTLDLLLGRKRSGPTRIAGEVGQRFREVMVDEYQDSNAVQDAIFEALTHERNNCFMVGDVKQSIYQFRLADPGIFLGKYQSYGDADRAAQGQGRRVLLSRNFRSGGAILEAANDVFRRCMSQRVGGLDYGDGEALQEGIPHKPLGEPEVELHVICTEEDSYEQEAQFVAERIEQLLSGSHMIRAGEELRPITAEDIVILLRSPGSVGQDFQQALAKRNIRCAFGGGKDLLQTGEIGALVSLLRIISNPRQDIALLAAMASPVFGFTADELAAIRAKHKNGEVYESLRQDDSEKTQGFLSVLEQLRRQARTGTLARLLEQIFLLTRIDSIYAAMDGGVERTDNLRMFYNIAVEFESGSGRDLEQFLEYLDSLEDGGLTIRDAGNAGAVTIMSIHKSKGLEFPVVFLSGLARSFNRESMKAQVLCDKELGLGMSAVDQDNRVRYPTIAKRAIVAKATKESLSEEMRVLYVAMTRARDRLIMTYAAKTPEKELQQLGYQADICSREMLAENVACPGEWVFMEAMNRIEAGALFSLAGCRPGRLHSAEYPWLIQTHEGIRDAQMPASTKREQEQKLPEPALEIIRKGLGFSYPYRQATAFPSKQTATQLKGREKDQEAAENTQLRSFSRNWRKPDFAGNTGGGKEYGTAMHTLMQYIRFENCADALSLEAELQDLVSRGLLTREQAGQADREGILAFFRSPLGQRLMAGENVLREFKFSILDDGSRYDRQLKGETVLLQGVVDCALVEDEITVVDFKTDRVTAQSVAQTAERYRGQVEIYGEALERIYRKKVAHKYLYFFRLRQFVEIV